MSATIKKTGDKMTYTPQTGDIFLCDSNRTGAKIVKFLMQAPTLWCWIWRQITGKQDSVRFYHGGMVLNTDTIIEQQWKVQLAPLDKILSRTIIIYRYKYFTDKDKIILSWAKQDIGKVYDIPQLIGKTLTWLTGIRWFTRILSKLSKSEEICVSRIHSWLEDIMFCPFGVKTSGETTTKIIDEYCQSHLNEWEIVYQHTEEK